MCKNVELTFQRTPEKRWSNVSINYALMHCLGRASFSLNVEHQVHNQQSSSIDWTIPIIIQNSIRESEVSESSFLLTTQTGASV
jgi:hypothetical protein